MLYEPIDTVLLVVGVVLVAASAVALLTADERRVTFLIAVGCGVGACIVGLGAMNAWGPAHERGRDLFHTGLLIAGPLAVAAAVAASRYVTPKLGLGWAVLGALGGVAAIPLAGFLLITAACGGGQCN